MTAPTSDPTPPLVAARDHLQAAREVLHKDRVTRMDVRTSDEIEAVVEDIDTVLLKLREVGHALRWAE